MVFFLIILLQSTNDSEDQAATPDSTKPYSGVPIIVPTVEPYRYQTYPQTSHPIPPMTLPLADVNTHSFPCSPVAINLMASKSMNVDGSDLPHSGKIIYLLFIILFIYL